MRSIYSFKTQATNINNVHTVMKYELQKIETTHHQLLNSSKDKHSIYGESIHLESRPIPTSSHLS